MRDSSSWNTGLRDTSILFVILSKAKNPSGSVRERHLSQGCDEGFFELKNSSQNDRIVNWYAEDIDREASTWDFVLHSVSKPMVIAKAKARRSDLRFCRLESKYIFL